MARSRTASPGLIVLRLRQPTPEGYVVSTPVYYWRRLRHEWTGDDTAVLMATVMVHEDRWAQDGWTAVELVDRFAGDQVLWLAALPVENWRSLEGAMGHDREREARPDRGDEPGV